MNRTEAPSAQCRSSTTSSCGRPAASAATSQYRPWRTPKDGSASPGGAAPSDHTIGAASAAAPAKARPRASPDMPRSRGSSSCRTTPHAYARSNSDPRAPATAKSPRLRRVAGRHQETRLADTRRTLHDDHASRARGHLVDRTRDHAQLALSLVESADHARTRVYGRPRAKRQTRGAARVALPTPTRAVGIQQDVAHLAGRTGECCFARQAALRLCLMSVG